MRGLMCRAAVVAGAAAVLLGPAVGVASTAEGAAATATAQSQQSQNQKLPRYSLTVLGTLGGTFSQAGGGINNRGQVAGWSALRGDRRLHAVVWDHGVMTDLGTLGGPNSFTPEDPALNSRGAVVGFSDTARQDPNQEGFCGLASRRPALPCSSGPSLSGAHPSRCTTISAEPVESKPSRRAAHSARHSAHQPSTRQPSAKPATPGSAGHPCGTRMRSRSIQCSVFSIQPPKPRGSPNRYLLRGPGL